MKFYNVKVIYCNDRVEVYKYTKSVPYARTNNQNGRRGKNSMELRNTDKNKKQNLIKARNEIIRLVHCNPDLTTFITLTYADNMQDIKQSKADLSKCFRLLQKFYPSFKYLYVLEFQSRGAIHYHVLCNLPVPVSTAKSHTLKPEEQKEFENFFREVFWEHGFVDIRDLKAEGNTNVGLYVSVYLVEDLFSMDLQGNKCYGFSRNLNRPVEDKQLLYMNNNDVVAESVQDYDIHYIANYKIEFDSGNKKFSNTVTYFDMYKKES